MEFFQKKMKMKMKKKTIKQVAHTKRRQPTNCVGRQMQSTPRSTQHDPTSTHRHRSLYLHNNNNNKSINIRRRATTRTGRFVAGRGVIDVLACAHRAGEWRRRGKRSAHTGRQAFLVDGLLPGDACHDVRQLCLRRHRH